MGLDLTYAKDGFTRGYWGRMKFTEVDYDKKVAEVILRGYASKAAQSTDNSTGCEIFVFKDTDFDDIFLPAATDPVNQNAQERAYVKIKTLTRSTLGLDWTTASDNI